MLYETLPAGGAVFEVPTQQVVGCTVWAEFMQMDSQVLQVVTVIITLQTHQLKLKVLVT